MTDRLRVVFYILMMLLVGAVVVGIYFDRPRDNSVPEVPAAAAADNTAAQPPASPVTGA